MRNKNLTTVRDMVTLDLIYNDVLEGIREITTSNTLYSEYPFLFRNVEAARNYYRQILGKKGNTPRTGIISVETLIDALINSQTSQDEKHILDSRA